MASARYLLLGDHWVRFYYLTLTKGAFFCNAIILSGCSRECPRAALLYFWPEGPPQAPQRSPLQPHCQRWLLQLQERPSEMRQAFKLMVAKTAEPAQNTNNNKPTRHACVLVPTATVFLQGMQMPRIIAKDIALKSRTESCP